MLKILALILLLLIHNKQSVAALPEGWQERSFVGHTRYQFLQQQGKLIIRADTQATASMLFKKQRINLLQTPIVTWRWRVANTYGVFDERSKAGDDYPARFYVVFKTGPLPWQTLAVNYVWSSNAQLGDEWPNAFTKNAMMVVLRAGDAAVGQWLLERRNIVADFKRLFDVDISHLDGYAIMVDGDNTGSKGTAWFSDIAFVAD